MIRTRKRWWKILTSSALSVPFDTIEVQRADHDYCLAIRPIEGACTYIPLTRPQAALLCLMVDQIRAGVVIVGDCAEVDLGLGPGFGCAAP